MPTIPAARPARKAAAFVASHRVFHTVLLSVLLNLVLESLCRRSWTGGVRFLVTAPMQFVYGTGVGEPFPQALQQGVSFLPVEYLQDMMA